MTTFNSQNFKIGPCAVIYKGDVLGITRNSSVLEFKAAYHDVKCSRAYQQSLEKHLLSMTISLTTEIMSVDNGLGLFLDENECITLDRLGEKQRGDGGELLLIPVNPSDMVAYRLPNAMLLRNSACSFNENEEHTLLLEFEANFDEREVLFERIPVDEAQRVSIDNVNTIDPAAFERAMTAYIADKLNMTVDTDIYRGGIPVSVDGCAVVIKAKKVANSIESDHYFISFFCVDKSRDFVMEKVKVLEEKFPVYGENITVDGIDNVNLKAVLKIAMEFSKIITDDGAIKTFGELLLEVII